MSSLPRKAQIYIGIVYLLGLSLLLMATVSCSHLIVNFWELGLFCVLAALAGGKKFRLMRHKGPEDVGSFSIGFAITFTAMLRFGLIGAMTIATVSCLSSCLYPKRQPFYQLFFNLALTFIHSWAMAETFLILNGRTLLLNSFGSFPALAASCLICFALNTGAVAVVIGLCTNQGIPKIWQDKFLWTAPSYFIGAFISTVSNLLLGEHAGAVLLFGSPIAYLTYKSFALYFTQTAEKEQHIEQLQSSHAELTDRCQRESQLAHERKMQSIGRLAAGIAHEINTPIQFIGDNTRFLKEAFESLISLHESYTALLAANKSGVVDPALVAEVEAATEAADLEFLQEEIPSAIQQSLGGIGRVAHIVQAMKEFSNPDALEKVAINLNHAIESTLTVAGNEWRYVAEVLTDFDPMLPLVTCLPGDFNQVILNLLINAAHAIAEVVNAQSGAKGTITICTRQEEEWVVVRIGDTGTGIPEAIRSRVFDPFFTTKEVGKGMGQGLTIAHSIVVDKHGGTIHFETEEGNGTTFIVRLPLQAQATQRAEAA